MYKEKVCKKSNKIQKQYKSTDKCPCEECKKETPKKQFVSKHKPNLKLKSFKSIPKVSAKRKKEKEVYDALRIKILSEAKFKCFVDGCKNVATTLEHQKGRKGYADEWARENKISLYIDERFLKPCCYHHNIEFENNPELSKKYQLSKLHQGKKL